ncbi:prepilin-type N-terminal cleavage/methylation domain-containing protein [Patescibacteria group bacterium]|nr:prepilin-type N-terminal cleavage/methylation domain-containing protein [Patescibacteria group bacterium]MBU0880120.1 prepilin-type N-terminal cleavage/methylation domain-containing protein [Patescibacteria group bacterium]MBU0898101.1 prepilin-type N-terminal cleavage/methylation domain-containing protein [Patescibacteria group bacterium]MBU1783108.1 prepilin-type N-terminal cleavage/methylation domain-containing protein [Patescibacteria group bacterium]MBU1991809.1 prepilin-type N-terminal
MKKQKGFTLIELLVVIAIIGLLSTLAVVALNNARMKARDARRVTDVKQMQTALELYYNDAGKYPANVATGSTTSGTCLSTSSTTPAESGFTAVCNPGGVIYMAKVPFSPTPVDSGCGAATSTDYAYTRDDDNGTTYTINYCLGAAVGEIPKGPNKATPAGIK